MKKFTNLILGLGFTTLVGCGIGGIGTNGRYYTHPGEVKDFVSTVNTAAGTTVLTVAKTNTWQYNFAVIKSVSDGKFYAVNMKAYKGGMTAAQVSAFLGSSLASGDIVEVTKNSGAYNNYRAADGTLFEETMASAKDLEKVGAINEGLQKVAVAKKLEGEYGLSEKRSYEVADLTMNWEKISNNRAMTEKDGDLLSKKIFGVNVKRIKDALKDKITGNNDNYERVLETAARINEISPEHLNTIIEDLMN